MVGHVNEVAVCGAGIGGLVLAIRLNALGFKPVLFEARSGSAIASEGEFFTIAPNGMNALRAINCYDNVLASGIDTNAIEFLNGRGRRLAWADQSDHSAVFGAPSITLRRGCLAAILLGEAERRGIDIQFGRKVLAARSQEEFAVIEFDDGDTATAAIVVGADGLRSSIRQSAFPDFPEPYFTGLVGVGGIVDADVPATGGAMRMVFGASSFFGYLRPDGGPVYWFSSYTAETTGHGVAGRPECIATKVRGLHAHDPDPVQRILAGVETLERTYPIFDMPPLPTWSRKRVVLLGDAAHAVGPHAGQGAAMAIEDALVLAACLGHSTDLRPAFERYETLRRPRIDNVVALTARNKSSKQVSGQFALMIRDLILPWVLPIGIRAGRRLYAFRADIDPLTTPSV